MGPSLYEISKDIQLVLLKLDDAGGELTPELEAEIDALGMDFDSKVDNVLRWHASQALQASAIDIEVKRLTALRNGYKKSAESAKDYVFRMMQATKIPKVLGRLFTCWVQKNSSGSAKLLDNADGTPGKIPKAYRKVTITFDSEKAYADYRAGAKLPPGIQVIEGSHLRIK